MKNLLTRAVGRVLRSRIAKWVVGLAVLLIAFAAGKAASNWVQPKSYYVSEVAFSYYRKDKVPKEIINKLEYLERRHFTTRGELIEYMRKQLEPQEYAAHQAVLEKHIRTINCGPNRLPFKVHLVGDSRGHPLHNAFDRVTVIPQAQLPPVTTDLAFLPGGEGVVMVGKFGHVTWFGLDWKLRAQFQVPDVFDGPNDQGALGVAVDPQFTENRFIYVAFVNQKSNRNVVQRFALTPDAKQVVDSRRDVIRFNKDGRVLYHGIGNLAFTKEGVLLIQVGDPTKHTQTWGDLEGKLLGVVPNPGPEGGYSMPPASVWEKVRAYVQFGSTIVYAAGLRSPFAGTMWGDKLVIADTGGSGPNSVEKIDVFTQRGQNFGWNGCMDPLQMGGYDPPAIAYIRREKSTVADDPLAPDAIPRSVIVGVVYDGASTDRYAGALDRRLLYSDFYLGFLRGAKLDDAGQVVDDVLLTHLPFLTSMAIGPDGYIYGTTAIGIDGFFRFVPRTKQPAKN